MQVTRLKPLRVCFGLDIVCQTSLPFVHRVEARPGPIVNYV
jgi:hypothetical protein